MTVRYGKFEMPEKVQVEEGTPTFSRFIIEPFERGFGHTVGNFLRRVMLSSLEAPAVVSVILEGVSHEYMSVEGIVEDMTNIVLNLKGALLRQLPEEEGEAPVRGMRRVTTQLEVTPEELRKLGGQKVFTLGEVLDGKHFEVVNPDLPIFTATQPMKRRIDLRVAIGRGFVPTEQLPLSDKVIDEIAIDACFSPVRLVNYRVENCRVGQATDFDKLILEVKTDGRVSPQEALSFSSQIGLKHLDVFKHVEEREVVFQKEEEVVNSDREEMLKKLAQKIGEIELSVRSTNCLNGAGIRYIGELATMREGDMLRFRNFGKKSLCEIRDKLLELGLSFDMKSLDAYGFTRDNIVSTLDTYIEERGAAAAIEAAEEEEGEHPDEA